MRLINCSYARSMVDTSFGIPCCKSTLPHQRLYLLNIIHFMQKRAQSYKMRPMAILPCRPHFPVALAKLKSDSPARDCHTSLPMAKKYGEMAGLLVLGPAWW